MCLEIKKMNQDRIVEIEKCLSKIKIGFPDFSDSRLEYGEQLLFHYTSFEKLFSILDNDSFWASRSRFSNDSTEDKLLGENWLKKEQYYGDNYILCFCKEDDVLSQWRGYCPQGGATIGLQFPKGFSTYALLNANCESVSGISGEYIELYQNRPLPVIYCQTNDSKVSGINIKNDLLKLFSEPEMNNIDAELYDIVPYLKNSYFFEEKELRLVFNNSNRDLENCIRFRKLDDGSMVPYIVVKYGNLLEMGRDLSYTYSKDYVVELFNQKIKDKDGSPIIIPAGRNQADACAFLSNEIISFKKKIYNDDKLQFEQEMWEEEPIRVLCDGHLPIVSITVSPSPNQEYMKEVIERFCKSRYWLQNVEVKCSKIPYIAPKL